MGAEMIEATPQVVADGGPPLGATPPAAPAAQPQSQSQSQSQQQQAEPQRVMSIPHSAMARIKTEERERGRAEALASLAQQAGFESMNDLAAALASLKSGGRSAPREETEQPRRPQTPQAPAPNEDANELIEVKNARRELARYERNLEKLQRERDELTQRYSAEQQARMQLQEALDAKEAEATLRETAVGLGVKDVDYALRLLTRELEGKDEAAMAAFDERAFFDGLRKTKPYLFGETVLPATTGPGAGAAPPAPKPGQVQTDNARNGHLDARKMNGQEFNELLRKRGLDPNR